MFKMLYCVLLVLVLSVSSEALLLSVHSVFQFLFD